MRGCDLLTLLPVKGLLLLSGRKCWSAVWVLCVFTFQAAPDVQEQAYFAHDQQQGPLGYAVLSPLPV